MTRYLLYITVGLAAAMALAYGMALQYNIDPLASDMALYWAVIAMTGVYISVRIAGIIGRRRKRGQRPDDLRVPTKKGRKASPDSIEARMEARRERVRRAQEKLAKADDVAEGGDEDER